MGRPAVAAPAGPALVRPWPGLAPAGVTVAVTTRDGGVSTGPYRSLNLGLHVGDDPAAVVENRRRAARAFGSPLGDLVFAEQVHGTGVTVVGRSHAGRGTTTMDDAVPASDALVTTDRGVVLAVLVADCVPIALVDPEAGVLAVVHAGWRGTVAGVCGAALGAMAALGARADRTVAALGPSIPVARYQVGPEVVAAVRDALGADAALVLAPEEGGRARLDLPRANRLLLARSGVRESAMVTTDQSTGAPGPFFSDRQRRPCGRFALLARLGPYDGAAPTGHGSGGAGPPPPT